MEIQLNALILLVDMSVDAEKVIPVILKLGVGILMNVKKVISSVVLKRLVLTKLEVIDVSA